MTLREQVYNAINEERYHQELKYGKDREQSLAGFLLIMESELNEAKLGWIKNSFGRSATLNEIVQLAAVCVACLEKYGLTGSAASTDDIPHNQN